MKKVLFVTSHIGSGSTDLVEILNQNNRVYIHNQSAEYDHPSALEWFYATGHKNSTTAAIYGDHLLYNPCISCKRLYQLCKFIYFIRSPRASLNEIAKTQLYKEAGMLSYYTFRLRRLCSMARQTPGAVFLTWDNVVAGQGYDLIEDYLDLNTPLQPEHDQFLNRFPDFVNYNLINKAEEAYEKYLYYMRQLDLRQVK